MVTTFLDPSGRTLSVVIGRSLCPECDAEALRVMHQVIWLPATPGEACSGKENYISVPFDPGKYKRWVKGRHERTGKVFDLPVDTSLGPPDPPNSWMNRCATSARWATRTTHLPRP